MTSKLSVLCDRIIEAGWLVALVVAPLLFDVHSSRTFDLDKVASLRSVALVMALAWLVRGVDVWAARASAPASQARVRSSLLPGRAVIEHPAACLALLGLAISAIATAVSIAPRVSLLGSYERFQGLSATAAYLVVFLSILALLRTREQLDRLVSTLLVVSLPVSLYGIIQHFGTDPIAWQGSDVRARAASTLGNPIFVGAYLVMVVPLTFYRLLESERALVDGEGRGTKAVLVVGSLLNLMLHVAAWWIGPRTGTLAAATTVAVWVIEASVLGKPLVPFLRVGVYCVILSTQLAGLLLSQSRGPWLAFLAGVFCFLFLWTLSRKMWRTASLMTAAGMVALLTMVLLNVPNSPLSAVRASPYLGRLGQVFDATGQVRVVIWEGAWRLFMADPLRAVIGYGPDTMRLAYPPFNPPELGQLESRATVPSRSHNETLDLLVNTGLAGLAIYLLLLTSLVSSGLRALNLVGSARSRALFVGLWAAGGGAGIALSLLLDHSWRFVGVAVPLGMVAGMFAYLSGLGVRGVLSPSTVGAAGAPPPLPLLAAVLLSAIIAHFVEIQFGIAVAATRASFWAYAAMLIAVPRIPWSQTTPVAQGAGSTTAPARTGARRGRRRGHRLDPRPDPSPAGAAQRLRARRLLAGSLVVAFVLSTMVYGFLSFPLGPGRLASMLWLFAFTWLCGGLIVVVEARSGEGGAALRRLTWLGDGGLVAAVSAGGPLLFLAAHKGMLVPAGDATSALLRFYALMLLAVGATGAALLLGERLPRRGASLAAAMFACAIAVGGGAVMRSVDIDAMRADIVYKAAWLSLSQHHQPDRAVALARRAVELAPAQDFYHRFLAEALLEKGKAARTPREREGLFRQAEASFERARELSPLNSDYPANLARLQRIWAQYESDAAGRRARLDTAVSLYREATTRSPNSVLLWNEWGATHLAAGNHDAAVEKFRRSLTLDPGFATTYLSVGDVHSAQGRWREAAPAYERAVALDGASSYGHRALGAVYANLGRLGDAERHYRRALDLAPNDPTSHRHLAQVYSALGRVDRALAHAGRALELAPQPERPAAEQLVASLRQRIAAPSR